MYSLLPALVSGLFLGYGIYVLVAKGFNRISVIFFLHCITTFFWQGTWAVLFQVRDPALAAFLVKFGYLFILFLPTTLYHFLAAISDRQKELKGVYASYGLAAVLAGFNFASNMFVDGYYDYFWGYYPKAGCCTLFTYYKRHL
jgi:two-component system, CAI-1 autoinducer sensor kinase/phosphatase CqsS